MAEMMKGNEAIAEAAVRAGARFYAGYPITPSSEIMEYLSWRMNEVGGAMKVFRQSLSHRYVTATASEHFLHPSVITIERPAAAVKVIIDVSFCVHLLFRNSST